MDKKEKLRKWLWLGLDETTAKKYQRKLSAENVRIIRNESVIIAGIGALYTICMLVLSHVYVKSLVCIIGAAWMFCIFLYTHSLLKKQDEISKQETYASIGSFMICAYAVSIYVGTIGAGNELAVTIVSLFVFLPKFLIGQLISHTAIPDNSRFVRSLLEGIIKIAIFLGYMACTGLMKDIRRTYEYHGAEHKTIACYEAGEELTVENVKKHTRFHPRCGTSFIFITLIVSILVMCIVPIYQVLPRVIVSILLLPVVVGISYEFIRIAGKSNNWLTRALSWPGLQIQRITTREPDASQIECAIAALKPCIPEDMEDDKW